MRVHHFFITALFATYSLLGAVYLHEIKSFDEIANYIAPNMPAAYFFDIDCTVAVEDTRTGIGSTPWFIAHFKRLQERTGLPADQAFNLHKEIFFDIQHTVWMRFVCPHTGDVIAQLQQQGHPVFALTKRSTQIAHRTHMQLRRIGINFALNNPESVRFSDQTWFTYGYIFCGDDHKEIMVLRFFEWLQATRGLRPNTIVIVDDTFAVLEKYKQNIAAFAAEHGYPENIYLFHFNNFAEHVRGYFTDPETQLALADEEWAELCAAQIGIHPDEQAHR